MSLLGGSLGLIDFLYFYLGRYFYIGAFVIFLTCNKLKF